MEGLIFGLLRYFRLSFQRWGWIFTIWPISEAVKTVEWSIVKFKRAIRNGEPMTADKGLALQILLA